MKKLGIALGGVAVVAVGGLLALPSLIPAEKLRQQVVETVKSSTGRDLTIDGKVAVTGFPSLGVQVGNVALSSPAGFQSKELVRLGALDVQLRLLPLLTGKVEIASFVLVDPVISLEVNGKGQTNWSFDTPGGKSGSETKSGDTQAKPAPAQGGGGSPLSDLSLGEVRLQNGKVSYVDAKAGTREEVEGINLVLTLKNLDSPFKARGEVKWHGKVVALDADLARPRALLDGSNSAAALSVSTEPVKLSFKGEAMGGKTMGAKGETELSIASIRTLAQWATGKPLDMAGTGLGPFSVKGTLAAAGPRIALTNAAIGLDAIKARGDFEVNTANARPALKGRLDVDTLDLNPYLPADKAASPGQTPTGGQTDGAKPSPNKTPTGWSDAPIDLSGLKAADVDFALTVAAILVKDIKVDKSALTVALHNGRLTADLTELNLYKGRAKGKLGLDGSSADMVGLDANFALKDLAAEPFLKDAAGFDRIDGTGNADIQVSARGKSQRALVQTLNGKGGMTFLNGSVKGINLAEMMRNVGSAFTKGGNQQKTDFAELGGTFTIVDGLVTNKDLSLKSPLLRVEGAGTVELPPRTVHYRVTPKVVASLEGQGGKSDLGGLSVPVIIEGPWDNVSYRPDLAAAVKGQAAKAIGDALSGKAGASGAAGALPINPGKLFGR